MQIYFGIINLAAGWLISANLLNLIATKMLPTFGNESTGMDSSTEVLNKKHIFWIFTENDGNQWSENVVFRNV